MKDNNSNNKINYWLICGLQLKKKIIDKVTNINYIQKINKELKIFINKIILPRNSELNKTKRYNNNNKHLINTLIHLWTVQINQ